jgi:hypothetical protein
MLQRAFDPFFGSGKDVDGTIVCNIKDSDFAHFRLGDDEKLRSEFNQLKEHGDSWEMEEDERLA